MKNLALTIILIISVTNTFSQTINQTNEKGEKIGFWEVKLDQNLRPTENENFSYLVYNRYDKEGEEVYIYERDINKLFKNQIFYNN